MVFYVVIVIIIIIILLFIFVFIFVFLIYPQGLNSLSLNSFLDFSKFFTPEVHYDIHLLIASTSWLTTCPLALMMISSTLSPIGL